MTQLAKIDLHKRGTVKSCGHTLTLLAGNADAPGEPVVLIHGIISLPLYARMTLLTPTLQDRPWYAISLPGHAGATYPDDFTPADLTPERIGEIMAGAVRQLTDGKPALIIGHSTGGTSALLIAASAPELASAVISVSGFVIGRWGSSLGFSQQLARLAKPLFSMAFFPARTPLAALNARFHSRLWAKDWNGYRADDYNRDILAAIHDDMKLATANKMWPWFYQMPRTDVSPLLKQIKAPVLAIAGDKDPVVPPEHARIIAESTGGKLVYLQGVGHLPMQEHRVQFTEAVDTWLTSL